MKQYLGEINQVMTGRSVFRTGRNLPFRDLSWSAKVGDTVAIFLEGDTPFILRCVPAVGNVSCKWKEAYRLVGDCYIHGIMEDWAIETMGLNDCKFVIS
jgi:hypothetical protein